MKIGDLAKATQVSVDTLRYYEKIGLLTDVKRNQSGYRYYTSSNVEQVRFIRNAQHSGFSLDEIAQLIAFRVAPVSAKPKVRELAERKASDLSERIQNLVALRDELLDLVNLCSESESYCPILDSFNDREDTQRSKVDKGKAE